LHRADQRLLQRHPTGFSRPRNSDRVENSRALRLDDGLHNARFESLLGRDALDHFVMHFDQRAKTITLGT
jgi:hypothetical protein